jgi:glycosyltransferase involved in cell wall biosynthesis
MKIAVFHNLPPGGAKRTLYEEVKSLSKKHELHLFEFTSTNEEFLDIRPYVQRVYRTSFEIGSWLPGFLGRLERDYKNFIKLAKVHRKIAEKINKGNYNVALIHADKFTQAPFILKFLTIPSLYFCQEYLRIAYEKELEFKENVFFLKKWYEFLTRKMRRLIDKKNAQAASLILVNSRFTQKNIRKAFDRKSQVCHLGVDPDTFKPSVGKKKNIVLLIGGKNKIKGYNLAVEALKLISADIKPELLVVGFLPGEYLISDDEKLARIYSEAKATLCLAYSEPFGLSPIESMACGTPVLAVNEGGYKETVVDAKTGFLLNRDPKKFAEKVLYLIKHPKIVEKMGKAARQHVLKNFSWERHNQCLEKHLKSLSS